MWKECADGIIRIPVPLPGSPLKYTNSYLIRGPRNLLIDTGFHRPECRLLLRAALDEMGVSLAETDYFITHHHSDHVGLAAELAGETGIIYIGRVELSWLRSYQKSSEDHPGSWERFDQRFAREGFPKEELIRLWEQNPARIYAPPQGGPYVPVEDGQVLQYGGYRLICRSMPGHTPGHMCLHLPERKLMFLGDHVLFDITPNIIAWPGVENALGDYCESLRILQQYDIQTPLPGHREAGMPLQERITALLLHHQTRLAEAEQIVREQPGLTAYELAGKMTWKIRSRSWAEFPLAQKWFAVGEAMAHVDELLARGALIRQEDKKGVRHYHGS